MKQPDPTCAYCDKPGELARDHVVPRSRGGPDNATNIVMACRSCNSAKGDQLPSEWLGDRCPPGVVLIEAKVNAKLKAVFKKRDYPKGPAKVSPPALYAFTVNAVGQPQYVGEVVSETPESIRMEPVSALSREMVDVPRASCRLFRHRDACVEASFKLDQATAPK
jgi:hypothetical protein